MTALTVSRLKGRPFYGQAMGQLRLTCTFSAECAQPEGCGGGCRRSIQPPSFGRGWRHRRRRIADFHSPSFPRKKAKRRAPPFYFLCSSSSFSHAPLFPYIHTSMLLYCHTMLPCFNLGFQPIKRKEPIFHLSPGVRPGPSSDPCFHQIQIYR